MTALYDAIGVYLNGAAAQDGRKVMLLYTDGGDTRSAMRFNELVELLKASDVTVYVIGELEHQGARRIEQRALLQQIADLTGGRAFFPTSVKDLDGMYDQDKHLILLSEQPLDQALSGHAIDLARTRSRLGQLHEAGPNAFEQDLVPLEPLS